MSTKTKLPKWFDGQLYSHGDNVTNPFSGESYKLNRTELSMYDFIKGAEYVISMSKDNGYDDPKINSVQNDMIRALDWFRKNNAKAYMVLLD